MTTYERLIQKGKIEGKIETVLASYDNGLAISLIANITSSSEEEVLKILKENARVK